MIKFQKHYVTNGKIKARVWYSLDNRIDGRKCVTLYAKDYDRKLGEIFSGGEYENNTDTMTDYFEKGKVVLFESSPYYAAARARAEGKPAPAIRAPQLPPAGARVGTIDGPGVFASDNPGTVLCHVTDQWGTHAVVLMDTGRTATCHGLNAGPGIGWHLLERATL
jgi:hypothetical protein